MPGSSPGMTLRMLRAQCKALARCASTFPYSHFQTARRSFSANASLVAAPAGARTRCLSLPPSKEGAERRFGAMDGSTRSARARLRPNQGTRALRRSDCGDFCPRARAFRVAPHKAERPHSWLPAPGGQQPPGVEFPRPPAFQLARLFRGRRALSHIRSHRDAPSWIRVQLFYLCSMNASSAKCAWKMFTNS
jgi:hypothetical protein